MGITYFIDRVRLRRAALLALFACMCGAAADPAAAMTGVVEDVSITNLFGYQLGNQNDVVQITGGPNVTMYDQLGTPGNLSAVGVNYTAYVDDGSFYFLHADYCVGTCRAFSQTTITFTLKNTNPDPVDLRFDSIITPGHIARIGNPALTGGGGFTFIVNEVTADGTLNNLFGSSGGTDANGVSLTSGALNFAAQNMQSGPDFNLVDWSASGLSVNLSTLASGDTMQLTYTARYLMTVGGVCSTFDSCPGVEVVFGDPRNKGGVAGKGTTFADILDPVIGADYDVYAAPYQIVEQGSAGLTIPDPIAPRNYGPLFEPQTGAVPEPATWIMMMLGFGIAGGLLRQGRSGRAPRPAIA